LLKVEVFLRNILFLYHLKGWLFRSREGLLLRVSCEGGRRPPRAHATAPIVVKADGLAAGKGVTVALTVAEAHAAVDDALVARRFGDAGASVVVEEFLDGEEASFFALVDGPTVVPLASAQDHKAVGEGDTGPNTGGMGAYSPAPVVTAAVEAAAMETIVRRTAAAMVDRGVPFTGVLFAGLMVKDGVPKLLEHNVRFGDPECEVLMVRLRSDLLELLSAAADGRLAAAPPPVWSPDPALTVVLAANGYPGAYTAGSVIEGVDAVPAGAKVFHAGTSADADGTLRAVGGRVLAVTASGASSSATDSRPIAASSRWASCSTSSGGVSCSTTRNSSPPRRQGMSSAREPAVSRLESDFSTSSPAG
jgi:phosphoribosylamine--glycine ligase